MDMRGPKGPRWFLAGKGHGPLAIQPGDAFRKMSF